MMHLVRKPTDKSTHLVLTVDDKEQPGRYQVVCFCPKSRRRKRDGGCWYTDRVLELAKPEYAGLLSVVHPS